MTDTERIEQLERLVDALAAFAVAAMNRHTSLDHRQYHYLKREDGSRCIYYTILTNPTHYVVFDTLDKPVK